ncbi:MAG TPA: hypothetical protein VEY06_12180 [Flavisolibacter sp.]|jgi:hypothetical protein|nr:hypothetical protein [Flavisolibacter sp.]
MMKKIFGLAAISLLVAVSSPAFAQTTVEKAGHGVKSGAKKAGKGIKKGAKAAANETAELATKGKSKITDKKSDEWVGPNGQAIYIDDGSKYFWINERGGREFVTKDKLKAKQK